MDKNSIIGLSLIGVILVTFTLLNKPSEKEITAKKEKADKEKLLENEADQKEAAEIKAQEEKKEPALRQESKPVVQAQAETVRLESDKLIVDISTKGGNVEAVYLKEYESYRNFKTKDKKIQPMKLFGKDDSKNELLFDLGGKAIKTGDAIFTIKRKSAKRIKLTWEIEDGKSITYQYNLKSGSYDLDFTISQEGINVKDVTFAWSTDLYKTERLLSEQKRVSTICYKYKGEDFDYLSEMADDEEKMENKVEWIAYKQSYFSTILKPSVPFSNRDAELKIRNFNSGDKKFFSHIKKYDSKVGIDLSGNASKVSFSWFFGPNDYEVLKAYDAHYEDIINYGWGLFRWINIYAIQPMFNVLAETGLGFGLVILLLTIILKLFLTPIQWKMYVSSAKMKILKPEIEALNAKFPKKEDAMKKQMEMMALYRESGASPLAGCIPMLIQMPILLAVFRFFPAAFELRQKPFLWAEDLSSYDSIYDFGMYIWPYGDHVSLFTLLMSVTTLLYTWQNSGQMQQPTQPGMPNMKVMMYIFPVLMIFFFNNYSSGLSYYYFISTLISILIMLAIKQFFVDENKLREKMAAKKASSSSNGGGKKKSKFQERLEQMQKMQQEKLKNAKK